MARKPTRLEAGGSDEAPRLQRAHFVVRGLLRQQFPPDNIGRKLPRNDGCVILYFY